MVAYLPDPPRTSQFFAGHVIDTRDGINFEGRSVLESKESMRRAVDDQGREPKIAP